MEAKRSYSLEDLKELLLDMLQMIQEHSEAIEEMKQQIENSRNEG